MKIKRVLSLFLAVAMMFSITAAAKSTDYVPDYDTETPVIIVHGMSQNNTYLVDENGEWIPDETGYVTAWPLEIDVMPLIERALPNMIASIATRRDMGLTEAMYEGTYNALSLIEKDNNGNYINDVEVPCYEMPMSELPEDVKQEYYTFLPIQELSEIIGEDDVYYFGYDSLGDVMHETEKLHHYIHDVVLPKSPNGQVKLCPMYAGYSYSHYRRFTASMTMCLRRSIANKFNRGCFGGGFDSKCYGAVTVKFPVHGCS